MKPNISALNDAERAWIKDQLQSAAKFVEAFSFCDAAQPFTLSALDRAFAAWIASEPNDRNLVNAVVNYTGAVFGHLLIECLGFEWVIATDEKGSDLAVYGCPGSGDILVFPANFIAKRWEKREINFIEKSYIQIASDVQKICQQHGGQRHHERPITS